MSVFNPPRSAAKASGIRSFDGARFVRRVMSITTGRKSEATPMSFIIPDRSPTVSMMIVSKRTSLFPPTAGDGVRSHLRCRCVPTCR